MKNINSLSAYFQCRKELLIFGLGILAILLLGINISPAHAAPPTKNEKVCFCHNIDPENPPPPDTDSQCVGFNAIDELTGTAHWNHYMCFLCNGELCDHNGPDHPDCAFCPPDPDTCSVLDTKGHCNGCGNGILEEGEECDDGDNDSFPAGSDTCDENCHTICTTNADCQDGLFCNGADTCVNGQCQHAGDPCTGGNSCNDECDEAANNCTSASNGDSCTGEDENPCTDGQCLNGDCEPVDNSESCIDDKKCTVDDICANGECNGSPKVCPPPQKACEVNVCNPDTGDCEVNDSGCNCKSDDDCPEDGNACTGKHCDTNTGECSFPPLAENTPCGDDQFCNGDEVCDDSGHCQPGIPPCEGNGECNDNCSEINENCVEPEGTPCTASDDNSCTDNQCNGSGECAAVNNVTDCDDGDICTVGDLCAGGACQSGDFSDQVCPAPTPPGGEAECVEPNAITGNSPFGGGCGSKCGNLITGTFDPIVVGIWTAMLMGPTAIAGLIRRRRK